MSRYLRRRTPDEEQHASNLELFYDLVFVLAVTQVSHLLLDDLTWRGAARALLILLVVWWAWNYTTWVTNVLDPDSIVVRLLVLAIMFGSLLMAVAIPQAFGSRALALRGGVRGDPGRAARVPDLCRRHARIAGTQACGAHPDLVRRVGRLLDRGCTRLRVDANRPLARRARARLRRSAPLLPGARATASSSPRRGRSRRRISPSGSSSS